MRTAAQVGELPCSKTVMSSLPDVVEARELELLAQGREARARVGAREHAPLEREIGGDTASHLGLDPGGLRA